jgi:ATP-dependent DNA ligase
MHATQVARPFHTKGWVYEEKYDGWQMLAVKDEGRVRLVSRNDRDHTRRFPAIVAAVASLTPSRLILDGLQRGPDDRPATSRHLTHDGDPHAGHFLSAAGE